MKQVLTTLLCVFCTSLSYAQTYDQKQYINRFFDSQGAKCIMSWMHPSCDFEGLYVYDISNNTVKFKVYFSDNTIFGSGSTFICNYRLYINERGNFISLSSSRCGNIEDDDGIITCGGAVSYAKFIEQGRNGKILSNEHPAIQELERLKGKSVSQFTGTEVVLAALYVLWKNDGYYIKY